MIDKSPCKETAVLMLPTLVVCKFTTMSFKEGPIFKIFDCQVGWLIIVSCSPLELCPAGKGSIETFYSEWGFLFRERWLLKQFFTTDLWKAFLWEAACSNFNVLSEEGSDKITDRRPSKFLQFSFFLIICLIIFLVSSNLFHLFQYFPCFLQSVQQADSIFINYQSGTRSATLTVWSKWKSKSIVYLELF